MGWPRLIINLPQAYHLLAAPATTCGGGDGSEGPCGSVGVLPFAISLWAIRDTEKGRSSLLTASIGFPSPSLPVFPGASLGMPHYNDYRWSFVGRRLFFFFYFLLLFLVCLFVVSVIPLLSQLVSFALS